MSTGDIYEKMQNLSDQRGSTHIQIWHFYRHKGAIITYALFYISIPVFSPWLLLVDKDKNICPWIEAGKII